MQIEAAETSQEHESWMADALLFCQNLGPIYPPIIYAPARVGSQLWNQD